VTMRVTLDEQPDSRTRMDRDDVPLRRCDGTTRRHGDGEGLSIALGQIDHLLRTPAHQREGK
jgi:hypothetical protein